VADEVHELNVSGHRVRRTETDKGYLLLETDGPGSRARIQVLLESWRPSALDWFAGQLVGETIKHAFHDDEGNLTIEFESGKSGQCAPHAEYEAWDVNVRPGEVRFALPGGGWSVVGGKR